LRGCRATSVCPQMLWAVSCLPGSLGPVRPWGVDSLPPIDERLVAALATQFPDVAPDLSMSDREIMFHAGNVHVVRWLKSKLEEQQEVL